VISLAAAKTMKIENKSIKDLIQAEYNPRQLSKEQFNTLKDSLVEFGFVDPIIINSNPKRKNIIIGGHQRVKVAKEIGIKEVPCFKINLSLEKEKELNVRLNKNTGDWDWDLLANNFDVESLLEWGFTEEDLQFEAPKKEGLIEDDHVPEVKEPICKEGDLWQLGEHRLLCGDATKEEDVELLMNGEKANMAFTDPPYLMDFTGSIHADGSKSYNSKYKKIKNDNLVGEDAVIFVNSIIGNINSFVSGAFYIFFHRLKLDILFNSLHSCNINYRALIIWNKKNHTLSNSDYMSKYEPIVYGWNNNHNFHGSKSNFDIWDIDRTKKNKLHPTMKPVELCVKGIENSSKKNESVLDLFLGSGSTLIACEKTNRNCYGLELDPHYCDVIIKRWEEYTGGKAEKI